MIISEKKQQVTDSAQISRIMWAILNAEDEADQAKEHVWVVGLNNKMVIQYIDLVHLGTLTNSVSHPRDIFRLAVSKGVGSIIMVHNHPSGDTKESAEDAAMTKRIAQAGEILGIYLLDHIIINTNGNFNSLIDYIDAKKGSSK